MAKWITATVLVLTLSGSVLAGVPIDAPAQECSATANVAGEMDCCALAQMQAQAPEVAAAKLCCAINCSQPAQTESMNSVRISLPATTLVHPPVAALPATSPRFPHSFRSAFPCSATAKPSYILNLALLI